MIQQINLLMQKLFRNTILTLHYQYTNRAKGSNMYMYVQVDFISLQVNKNSFDVCNDLGQCDFQNLDIK